MFSILRLTRMKEWLSDTQRYSLAFILTRSHFFRRGRSGILNIEYRLKKDKEYGIFHWENRKYGIFHIS